MAGNLSPFRRRSIRPTQNPPVCSRSAGRRSESQNAWPVRFKPIACNTFEMWDRSGGIQFMFSKGKMVVGKTWKIYLVTGEFSYAFLFECDHVWVRRLRQCERESSEVKPHWRLKFAERQGVVRPFESMAWTSSRNEPVANLRRATWRPTANTQSTAFLWCVMLKLMGPYIGSPVFASTILRWASTLGAADPVVWGT